MDALLFGMNRRQVDLEGAQEMVMNHAIQQDAVTAGFQALLLHPELIQSSKLCKDENEALHAWTFNHCTHLLP